LLAHVRGSTFGAPEIHVVIPGHEELTQQLLADIQERMATNFLYTNRIAAFKEPLRYGVRPLVSDIRVPGASVNLPADYDYKSQKAIGVDVGGTNTKIMVWDGAKYYTETISNDEMGVDISQSIETKIRELAQRFEIDLRQSPVHIGVPSKTDLKDRMLGMTNLGQKRPEAKAQLEAMQLRMQIDGIRVVFECDAFASAIHQVVTHKLFGRDVIGFTIGTGTGLWVMVDGKLSKGPLDAHLKIDTRSDAIVQPGSGLAGDSEQYTSSQIVDRFARQLLAGQSDLTREPITAKEAAAWLDRPDADPYRIAAETIYREIGRNLATVVKEIARVKNKWHWTIALSGAMSQGKALTLMKEGLAQKADEYRQTHVGLSGDLTVEFTPESSDAAAAALDAEYSGANGNVFLSNLDQKELSLVSEMAADKSLTGARLSSQPVKYQQIIQSVARAMADLANRSGVDPSVFITQMELLMRETIPYEAVDPRQTKHLLVDAAPIRVWLSDVTHYAYLDAKVREAVVKSPLLFGAAYASLWNVGHVDGSAEFERVLQSSLAQARTTLGVQGKAVEVDTRSATSQVSTTVTTVDGQALQKAFDLLTVQKLIGDSGRQSTEDWVRSQIERLEGGEATIVYQARVGGSVFTRTGTRFRVEKGGKGELEVLWDEPPAPVEPRRRPLRIRPVVNPVNVLSITAAGSIAPTIEVSVATVEESARIRRQIGQQGGPSEFGARLSAYEPRTDAQIRNATTQTGRDFIDRGVPVLGARLSKRPAQPPFKGLANRSEATFQLKNSNSRSKVVVEIDGINASVHIVINPARRDMTDHTVQTTVPRLSTPNRIAASIAKVLSKLTAAQLRDWKKIELLIHQVTGLSIADRGRIRRETRAAAKPSGSTIDWNQAAGVAKFQVTDAKGGYFEGKYVEIWFVKSGKHYQFAVTVSDKPDSRVPHGKMYRTNIADKAKLEDLVSKVQKSFADAKDYSDVYDKILEIRPYDIALMMNGARLSASDVNLQILQNSLGSPQFRTKPILALSKIGIAELSKAADRVVSELRALDKADPTLLERLMLELALRNINKSQLLPLITDGGPALLDVQYHPLATPNKVVLVVTGYGEFKTIQGDLHLRLQGLTAQQTAQQRLQTSVQDVRSAQ
ncbi:MAG: ROK family protein, partial [Candidatus Omnitrophota bacterium]